MQEELYGPQLPQELAYLWRWFVELRSGNRPGAPLSWSEIESYARLMRRSLHKWEVQALKELDNLLMQTHGKH